MLGALVIALIGTFILAMSMIGRGAEQAGESLKELSLMTREAAQSLALAPLEELQRAIEEHPDDPRPHYIVAHRSLDSRDDAEAIAASARALELRDGLRQASEDGELEASVRVVRLQAAIRSDIIDPGPDIDALCGPLRETSGGQWAVGVNFCSDF